MKTIVEYISSDNKILSIDNYINENYTINESLYLFKPSSKTLQYTVKIEDGIRSFLKETTKRYSLGNKSSLDDLFNDYYKFIQDPENKGKFKIDRKTLKEFGIIDGKSLAKLFIDNREKLEKSDWNLYPIKSFNKSELEKEYEKWKNSDDYVKGKKLDKSKYKDSTEEELKRVLVIYDRMDPGNEDTTIEYTFKGKRTKENEHQVNNIKMDWAKDTGLDYWKNANPILLSNYLKKTEAELAKREPVFDNDDLTEI